MRLSSILTAVDFTDDSLRGAQLASQVARRHGSRLTLLYVDGPSGSRDRSAAATKERLRNVAEPLAMHHEVDVLVTRGSTPHGIRTAAASVGADLIVLAPHGSTGADLKRDHVAVGVTTEAECPVLIDRWHTSAHAGPRALFSRPLLTVSNHQLADAALDWTMALAEQGSVVNLMHVLEEDELCIRSFPPRAFSTTVEHQREAVSQRLWRLKSRLERAGFTASVRVETGDPSGSVLCRIRSNPNDLVVASRKTHRDGSGDLSDHAYRMLRATPIPLLLVPQKVAQSHTRLRSTRGSSRQEGANSARRVS